MLFLVCQLCENLSLSRGVLHRDVLLIQLCDSIGIGQPLTGMNRPKANNAGMRNRSLGPRTSKQARDMP